MSDEIIIDGQPVGTGLLVPDVRPRTFHSFPKVRELSIDEIARITTYPNRTPSRERFGRDWIYNQGNIGSCNGCAGAKALERARVMRGLERVKLSGEGLYAAINGGRDVGSMLDDGMHFMVDSGVPLESDVPAREYRKSRIKPEAYQRASRFKALEPYRVDTESQLASGLALGFVGVVAVHATQRFSQLDGDGVVASTDGPGNHAVGVDDVRVHDGELQFDMFNSWGTGYGQDGRGWLSWLRHFRTTHKYHAFYLIRSTIDDQEGDNPI